MLTAACGQLIERFISRQYFFIVYKNLRNNLRVAGSPLEVDSSTKQCPPPAMKRSNSAPMIPDLEDLSKPLPPSLQSRRGLSTSNVSLPGDFARPEFSPRKPPLSSPRPIMRINSPTSRQHRVEQIKQEESIDERRNEGEVKKQLLLTQSWDVWKLDSDEHELRQEYMEVWPCQASPSHQPFVSPPFRVRSRSLTPTSPSSARTFSYRRSLSPVLRPSSLSIIGQKRRREAEQEEMDISPTMPAKKIQLGYASPFNLSPAVSPLTGNSPLHYSFSTASTTSTTSRKSSSHSESTPLSSPSSLNPFAVNYDSGNCEHWQSGSSSACQSPSVSVSTKIDLRSTSVESEGNKSVLRRSLSPGIIIIDDHRSLCGMDSSSDFSSEAPTPLSPKGLQFRHKPFLATLPSPIPRTVQSGTGSSNSSSSGTGLNPPRTNSISKPSLHHDKHLSPFNSDLSHVHGHAHTHPHAHTRTIRKGRSQLSTCTSSLGTARQMNPLKPAATLPGSQDHKLQAVPKQLAAGVSSPLAKLSMSSSNSSNNFLEENTLLTCSSPTVLSIEQKLLRRSTRRRESETSTDSLMESDVSSLEESLELCETGKECESNMTSATS